MNDIVPRLDDIEFDELVDKARGDIPRYAPAWTDHNLHDPGMTVIDLLAWIIDQQVYRAGFVGGRHRQAFAALLGRRPEGPKPARGLIWPSGPVREGRLVAADADVTCRQHADLRFGVAFPDDLTWPPDGAGPASVYLPPVALTGVELVVDGVALPPPALTSGGGSWALGSGGRLAGTVLTFRFDGPLGLPTQPACVSFGVDVAPVPGPALAPGDRPWGPVSFAYRVGTGRWVDLAVVHDGTAGLATPGAVLLAVPPGGAGDAELRLRFDRGFFPGSPQIQDVSVNVLPVVQRERVAPAAFPRPGTGQPDQEVELDTTDLVDPPSRPHGPVLEIEVDGERWVQRRDLARSGPGDRHYVVVHPDRVLFGNGLNGRCPPQGAQITHTGLARTRGAAGNVRRGLSWVVPALGPGVFGSNPGPMTGGADATGGDELAAAARQVATRRSALLTDHELVDAANGLSGLAVGRAEVVAHFDRRLGSRRADGVRTLVVLPHQPARTGAAPEPVPASQAYLDQVAARLAPRRVLGERLVVQGPVVLRVDVALTVTTEPGTPAGEVTTAVRRAVESRLSAVAVPDAGKPWPLGRDLTTVDVAALAATAPGVLDVRAVRVALAGGPLGPGPVVAPPDGVVVAGRVDVAVEPAGSAPRPSRSERARSPMR